MAPKTADVVVCGAGIAGVSVAYRLAEIGVTDVVVVDERPPLTLTSDKSTEAYRNWWPGPDDAMVRLMNRSIDLLEDLAEDCGDRFRLNRRGYLRATADPARADLYREAGERAAAQGAGALRIHEGAPADPDYVPHAPDGWRGQPDGADLILDPARIRRLFPYLAADVRAVLHTRRCGWLSGQQLGMEQLERARSAGARLLEGRVEGVGVEGSHVTSVRIATASGAEVISTRRVVVAAGPFLKPTAALLGIDLPVFSEPHLKVSFPDRLRVVPRDAPLLVWEDPQRLPWSREEREALAADAATAGLLEEMPPGVHLRPEGAGHVLVLWPYEAAPRPETWPLPVPPHYPEVCLRGMSRMVPGLAGHAERLPRPVVDGGYYTKTRENRPLAGPLPVEGAFVHGALSGFGLMASSATAELVALHVTGGDRPKYADAFRLERYDDPAYQKRLECWGETGQL